MAKECCKSPAKHWSRTVHLVHAVYLQHIANTLQYGGCLMVTIEVDVKEGNWFANQWQFGNHFYLGLGSIDDTRQAGLSSQGYWISAFSLPKDVAMHKHLRPGLSTFNADATVIR